MCDGVFVDGIDAPAFFDASYYAFIYGGDQGFLNWFGYADDGLNAALVGLHMGVV